MINYDISKAATADAAERPQVGDRFHEMFSFWIYVVDVQPADGPVTVVTLSPPGTLPDDGRVEVFDTAEAFRSHLAYGSIPGYWVMLADRGNNTSGWLDHIHEPVDGKRVDS